ncbi:hypothetical protein DPSP01_002572 [Paraphaeosphaeria sporulosa]|uniref:Uncharacterized protein n=1 Tax=Paraphaeosphaeria sporulosa TaxID=1460663 RepID=A0A177CVA8_9PLEO|nr:uncharacterized protein CC84DRAFT_37423 [Paraphaeosphaeria sporulosa]OAG11463.1 hypothetical protein CC84DRAFT_37423 [Paraphaeosphaeria sporulosa]
MSKKNNLNSVKEAQKFKFSLHLTSPIITVTVGKTNTLYIHSHLLKNESERLLKDLEGGFKEGAESAIELEDEDPNLFGYFVEYLYRDCLILSQNVDHYSAYVTLARLYALGERLMAPKFQAYALWRFSHSLATHTLISEESICELLRIACTEITERAREDPMRSQIFWYVGFRISDLQKFDMFRQLLCEIEEAGKQICLWMNRSQPGKPAEPSELQYKRFAPESEFDLSIAEVMPGKQ